MENGGAEIETLGKDQPLMVSYPISQVYFTIYTMNAFLIGRIHDADLRKAIVLTYTKARALIDAFRMNNQLLQVWEQADLLEQATQLEVHKQRANQAMDKLKFYGSQLKKGHAELKSCIQGLLRSLRKEGVLNKR